MSFFGDIGKALSGALNTVTKIADGVTNILQAPLNLIEKPLDGLVNGLLDKLPFGIGSFIEPFADQFLNAGIGMLAAGPLGGVMSTISSVAGVASKVDTVLDAVNGAVNGGQGISSLAAPAQQNAQEAFSWAQAQELFS